MMTSKTTISAVWTMRADPSWHLLHSWCPPVLSVRSMLAELEEQAKRLLANILRSPGRVASARRRYLSISLPPPLVPRAARLPRFSVTSPHSTSRCPATRTVGSYAPDRNFNDPPRGTLALTTTALIAKEHRTRVAVAATRKTQRRRRPRSRALSAGGGCRLETRPSGGRLAYEACSKARPAIRSAGRWITRGGQGSAPGFHS
jgi:hypothetical protein